MAKALALKWCKILKKTYASDRKRSEKLEGFFGVLLSPPCSSNAQVSAADLLFTHLLSEAGGVVHPLVRILRVEIESLGKPDILCTSSTIPWCMAVLGACIKVECGKHIFYSD
jgi:hypothetical protein